MRPYAPTDEELKALGFVHYNDFIMDAYEVFNVQTQTTITFFGMSDEITIERRGERLFDGLLTDYNHLLAILA